MRVGPFAARIPPHHRGPSHEHRPRARACRGQPAQRRQVARTRHRRRQSALGPQRPQARALRQDLRLARRRGRAPVRGPGRGGSSATWRPKGRCRTCLPSASSSRPGGSSAPIAWPPEWGWGPVPQPGGQESDLFEWRGEPGEQHRLGLALVRDGHGPRAFDTLLCYRSSAMAELWRFAARAQGAAGRGGDGPLRRLRATERTRNPQKCWRRAIQERLSRTPRSAARARSGGRTSPGAGPPAAGR